MESENSHAGKRITLTGGGTAGHVMVNLAILPFLQSRGWDVTYIGSVAGIEKTLIQGKLPYYPIRSGKLRRYFDWKNFTDVFEVLAGTLQSYLHLKKIKPHVIFSKGGFVSVPVVVAGWLQGIPVVAHEADITPGLANRICLPFISHICLAFPETRKHIKKSQVTVTGIPMRSEITRGQKSRGFSFSGFSGEIPVLLVIGGSSGSRNINQYIRRQLPKLLGDFQVLHICGQGNIDHSLNLSGYFQVEYINKEMADVLSITDLAISRAGANSIFELLSLKIPHVLIPLPLSASRGDQIENAQSFEKSGYSIILYEENFKDTDLLSVLKGIFNNSANILEKMENSTLLSGTDNIIQIIEKTAKIA